MEIFLKIFLIASLINLLYEVLHSFLYKTCLEASLKKYVYLMIKAAIFDGLAIAIIYFIASRVFRNNFQILAFSAISLIFAYFWEMYSSRKKKWEYSKNMPIILGVGLTPLIQLTLTGLLSIYILSNFC